MNTTELLSFHSAICADAKAIMARKNHDYAGSSGETPFANFEAVEALGITSTAQGFLVRMTDKLRRLSTFASAGELKVKDEGVQDTLLDLINYSVLLAAYWKQGKTVALVDPLGKEIPAEVRLGPPDQEVSYTGYARQPATLVTPAHKAGSFVQVGNLRGR